MEDVEVMDAPGATDERHSWYKEEEGQAGVVEAPGGAGPVEMQGARGPVLVVPAATVQVEEMISLGPAEDDKDPAGREEEEEVEEEVEEEEEWNEFILGAAEGPHQRPGVEQECVHLEWKAGDPVTPQHVLGLKGYTQEFLCSPADNIYNINFSRFKIRELQSGAVILDIKKHCPTEIKDVLEQDPGRFIQYHFSPAFLALKEIGATLEFTVGSRAVNRFRLIERHFFRDLLLKTFDFEIGFCIPYSRNTCEHIYSLPDLDPSTIDEMVASPFETRSDSFYFANNQLIMHHKAEYSFNHLDPGQPLSQ